MKDFLRLWLRSRLPAIGLFLLCCAVFALVFRLYGLPLDERLADYGKRFGLMEPKPMPPIETLFDVGVSKILWYDDPEHIAAWVSEAQKGMLFDKRGPWWATVHGVTVGHD